MIETDKEHSMDANIRTAATLLRNASYQMQARIRELRADEHTIQRNTDNEERHIRSDLLDVGRKMASYDDPSGKSYLVKRSYDLYQRSKQIKVEADKKRRIDENEIRLLESQSRKLDELARTLEMWQS